MFSKTPPSKTSRFAFLGGVVLLLPSAAVAAGPGPDMLGASPSSQEVPPPDAPPPDAPPPMQEAVLRETIPDIVIERAPPTLLVAPFVGTRWPYQATSFGVDLDLRLWPWLRVGGGYALGLSGSAERKELVVTNYAEAFMGLRILHGTGETTVNLSVKNDPPAQTGPVRALVPSDHALFRDRTANHTLPPHGNRLKALWWDRTLTVERGGRRRHCSLALCRPRGTSQGARSAAGDSGRDRAAGGAGGCARGGRGAGGDAGGRRARRRAAGQRSVHELMRSIGKTR